MDDNFYGNYNFSIFFPFHRYGIFGENFGIFHENCFWKLVIVVNCVLRMFVLYEMSKFYWIFFLCVNIPYIVLCVGIYRLISISLAWNSTCSYLHNWCNENGNLLFCILATTLDATNKTVKWDVVGDTKEFPNPFYKLIVRQFLLGHTAKDDEYNVVEVSKFLFCFG